MKALIATISLALALILPSTGHAADRSANQAVIQAFYAALEAKDIAKFISLFNENAVQEMPFSPPGFPTRVEGRGKINELFAGFPDATNAVSFPNLKIYPTDSSERFFVEVDGYIEFKSNPQPYRQKYINVFELKNGKISIFREYYNPIWFAEAIGIGRFEKAEKK